MRAAPALLAVLVATAGGRVQAGVGKPMEWPSHIKAVLENAKPLAHPRGRRLPLFLWPAMDPGVMTGEAATELVAQMEARGVSVVCRWDPARRDESLAAALAVARAQQKAGLLVSVDATQCLYSLFNGDPSTAHVDASGKPFWDASFGKADMGCPLALDHRRREIRERIEWFADGYRRAGIKVGFAWADWEIDGPIEWNSAWASSRRCTRCSAGIPNIGSFLSFQKAMRDLRSDLQAEIYSGPMKRAFPGALVGNYAVNPHDGFRYWYDYFEKERAWYPGIADNKTKFRHWAAEFERSGYTMAMPVVYTWSRMWNWSDCPNGDWRWFRPMLLEASSVGRGSPSALPIVSFVHWTTTDPPTPPDPGLKPMSRWAYQQLLWHMLLRGTDSFYLWCPGNENAQEVSALHEVWAEAQRYGDFLERGIPIRFDVPDKPGSVVSGLRIGDAVLVNRTDFTGNRGAIRMEVAGKLLKIESRRGVHIEKLVPLHAR